MRLLIFNHFALAIALASIGTAVVAEDLDAALEAQKKKAARRVYSEKAQLEDRKLTVPHAQSEEERLLDKKLREMDAEMDARPALTPNEVVPRPAAFMPRPQEDKNWLTAAVLDDLQSASMTNETDDDWLARELKRQRDLKDQESLTQENAMVEKILRDGTGSQPVRPEMNVLEKYQLPQPGILGGNRKTTGPGYMTPQSGTPDPMEAVRWTPKKDPAAAPALFSPEAARLSSSVQNSIRPGQTPSFTPTPGVPVRKASSVFSYGRDRSDPEPAPLTPIQMIRKAAPINRSNPFAEDHMPTVNTSIWD
jgi:hypothetical protein